MALGQARRWSARSAGRFCPRQERLRDRPCRLIVARRPLAVVARQPRRRYEHRRRSVAIDRGRSCRESGCQAFTAGGMGGQAGVTGGVLASPRELHRRPYGGRLERPGCWPFWWQPPAQGWEPTALPSPTSEFSGHAPVTLMSLLGAPDSAWVTRAGGRDKSRDRTRPAGGRRTDGTDCAARRLRRAGRHAL